MSAGAGVSVYIDSSDLGPLQQLASGGQGVVFAAPRLHMQYASSLVVKQYRKDLLTSLDVAVLESMPAYLESLPFAEGMELLSQAAWPCRLVDDSGGVAGFVMPAIPDSFYLQMRMSSGMSRERGEFQHLLNSDDFLARKQIDLTDRRRYGLLREVAQALSVFHRHGIAVGDLSPKNLLFSYDPALRVYFIDCDAMRFQGRSVMRQLETPGWQVQAVNPREELGTVASDSYKLGLLALRLLTGTQDTCNPVLLPRSVPVDILQLIAAALSADPARRPAPGWIIPLKEAAATGSTKISRSPTTITMPSASNQPVRANVTGTTAAYSSVGPLPQVTIAATQTLATTPGPHTQGSSKRRNSRRYRLLLIVPITWPGLIAIIFGPLIHGFSPPGLTDAMYVVVPIALVIVIVLEIASRGH